MVVGGNDSPLVAISRPAFANRRLPEERFARGRRRHDPGGPQIVSSRLRYSPRSGGSRRRGQINAWHVRVAVLATC